MYKVVVLISFVRPQAGGAKRARIEGALPANAPTPTAPAATYQTSTMPATTSTAAASSQQPPQLQAPAPQKQPQPSAAAPPLLQPQQDEEYDDDDDEDGDDYEDDEDGDYEWTVLSLYHLSVGLYLKKTNYFTYGENARTHHMWCYHFWCTQNGDGEKGLRDKYYIVK